MEEQVLMESFGRVLSWFGPLVVPGQGVVCALFALAFFFLFSFFFFPLFFRGLRESTARAHTRRCARQVILDKIRSLLQKRFFHGDISTREAETRLAGKGVGTFLVRFSTSAPGRCVLSSSVLCGRVCVAWVLRIFFFFFCWAVSPWPHSYTISKVARDGTINHQRVLCAALSVSSVSACVLARSRRTRTATSQASALC